MVLNDVTIENDKEIIGRYDFPNDKYPAGAVIERCSVVLTTDDKMCLCVKEKGKEEDVELDEYLCQDCYHFLTGMLFLDVILKTIII